MKTNRETGTLGKLVDVLDAVARAEHPSRFTDLLETLGQPRGTLHRHLSHLLEEGLLEVDNEGRYRLGLRLLEIASLSWSKNDLRAVCSPHLNRLQHETGETVHLGVLRETSVIYLDKVEGRQSVRMYSQIGNGSPAYCTGVGKAALSLVSDDLLPALLSKMEFHRFTRSTLDAASLLAEIKSIRERGYAFDMEEHEQGIRCIAAPIDARGSGFLGAVSITGPAYRLTIEAMEAWKDMICSTAKAVEKDIRLRLGPGR
ncbi:IclR family transcriptional regulator [Oryzifoliimicrobium ureilyticus]|uniref:IclR family transcriptional regulator n=1 Tax=Oryzifoliimicrobium ureilyticus TaxID=3113724 RepID=UPI00307613DB